MTKDISRIINTLGSTYWRWEFGPGETPPSSLIEALKAGVPHIDESSWEERIAFGGAFVNGRSFYDDIRLSAPCRVEYYEPKYEISEAGNYFPPFEEKRVIYKDDHVLAYAKPVGLPSLPTKEQRHYNLMYYIEEFISGRIHMPSRLDVSTSGLVVISIHGAAHAPLQQVFHDRAVDKRYMLEVSEDVAWENTSCSAAIGRDPAHRVLRQAVSEGGKESYTDFRKIRSQEFDVSPSSLIEAHPLSGRTHQIRVHTAEISTPIIGDNFYGGLEAEELHLLSYSLKFPHPATNEEMEIRVPDEFMPAWAK